MWVIFEKLTKKNSGAVSSEYVVDSRNSISSCCCESVASAVEANVENFIIVSLECVDAFSRGYVP